MKLLTETDVRNLIRTEIERAGSGHKLAHKWGVSAPFLSMVLSGRRAPGSKVLRILGLRRKTMYVALPSRPWLG